MWPLLHRFNISSSCEDPQLYAHAMSDARCVFDMGVRDNLISVISTLIFLLCVGILTTLVHILIVLGGNWIQHEYSGHRWWF